MKVTVKKSIKYNGERFRPGVEVEMDDKNAAECIASGHVSVVGAQVEKAEAVHLSPTAKARAERRAQAEKVEAVKAEEVTVTVETEIAEAPVDAPVASDKGGKNKGGK
jgi:ribosomal 50S subunit-recycling heat shock protein